MNIGLIGYGNMGKEIERLALERGWSVVAKLNSRSGPLAPDLAGTIDVGLHFASGASVVADVRHWSSLKKNLVIGTTGWEKDRETVRTIVTQAGIGVVAASNFSLGVNLFMRILREAARLVNRFEEYDTAIEEIHHRRKKDHPSGTALQLARVLLEEIRRKKEVLSHLPHEPIRPEQLQIASLRTGTVVGTHSVVFDSAADTLTLTHSAKNRTGFAAGALLAAEWVRGRRGFFTMDDVLGDLFHSSTNPKP